MSRHVVKDRTQIIPFPDASDLHIRLARSFALLNEWHAAIAGHAPVLDVITVLVRQTSARNISLYRLRNGRAFHIAAAARAGEDFGPERSRGGLAQYLLDTRPDQMTPGTVWRLSALRKEDTFAGSVAAREWANRPEILEVSLVVLVLEDGQIDAFEMAFDSRPLTNPDIPPVLVTQALAHAWSIRVPGVIARTILQQGNGRNRSAQTHRLDLLGADNPYGLSRAEQRVCTLLVGGARARDIAEALNLSVSTVRTQLRSIYAKTGTSGQVELITRMGQGTD